MSFLVCVLFVFSVFLFLIKCFLYLLDGVEWEGISTFLSSWLERSFTEEEIRVVVFECEGNKAPGPYGFSMALFQSQWDTVKSDIMKVFEEFYKSGIINGITNETFICLIPKKLNSCRVKDFRPISLVTSMNISIASFVVLLVFSEQFTFHWHTLYIYIYIYKPHVCG